MSPPKVRDSAHRYGRAIAGGLLLSSPLLYTMEVWWAGFLQRPERLLGMLLATLAFQVAYTAYAGLRDNQTRWGVVLDALELTGLALVVAAAAMAVLGQVEPDRPLAVNVGRIVVEGCVLSLGISVGAAQLGDNPEQKSESPRGWSRQQVTAACGALLLATAVGPTDEIPMLARALGFPGLLLLALLSLGVVRLILTYHEDTSTTYPTLPTYGVALTCSVGVLWAFGRLDHVSLEFAIRQVVVLGFPAALGAGAGADADVKEKRNWLEWLSAGVHTLVVLGVLAYLIWMCLHHHTTAPSLTIVLGTPQPAAQGYQVPFTVQNTGGQPAEAVQIEVSLASAAGEPETSTVTLDFVPEQDAVDGWVCFQEDATQPGKLLKARIQGFKVR